MASQDNSGRAAARAQRAARISGKGTAKGTGKTTREITAPRPAPAATPAAAPAGTKALQDSAARAASKQRRQAIADGGKAAMVVTSATQRPQQRPSGRVRPQATASVETPRPDGCGCTNCAGDQDATVMAPASSSSAGKTQRKPATRPVPTASSSGRLLAQARRHAIAAAGKKGAASHRNGAAAATVARTVNPDISGRDLSRAVREDRARNGRTGTTKTQSSGRRRPDRESGGSGSPTGTQVGPSGRETGTEVGLCRDITGTRYLAGEIFDRFCQTEPPRAPRKVETMLTGSGSGVTGTSVAPAAKVTGVETGACRTVTGDEYLGADHFTGLCAAPAPAPSATLAPPQARVTGTPYGGTDALARPASRPAAREPGERITGTQYSEAPLRATTPRPASPRPASPRTAGPALGAARPGEPDFPRPLAAAPAPARSSGAVTGSSLEGGRITGTFSLGEGKVTGTELFRLNGAASGVALGASNGAARGPAMAMVFKPEAVPAPAPAPEPAPEPEAAPEVAADTAEAKPRITGEGMDSGLRITGNDWARSERVTGTEGTSASHRNPTRRSALAATPAPLPARRTAAPSDILVTGSSGNTDRGAMVTVSGGARA